MPVKTITRICPVCGASFTTFPYRPTTYCTRLCFLVRRGSTEERFWAKVNQNGPIPSHCPEIGPCWVWTAAISGKGYGKLGGVSDAHRFSYLINVGSIPNGLWVLHKCDNPPCVRPEHLFLGTPTDNVADMLAKGRGLIGDLNPSRIHPERVLRGANHPFSLHPELAARGEQAGNSKLTNALVRYIREQVTAGRIQKDLAIELKLSKMTISRAIRGESWAHIKPL